MHFISVKKQSWKCSNSLFGAWQQLTLHGHYMIDPLYLDSGLPSARNG